MIKRLKRIANIVREFTINIRMPFVYDGCSVSKRTYKNKQEYMRHQKSKIGRIESRLKGNLEARIKAFDEAFSMVFKNNSNKSVLCLGARDGVEVLSLRKKGLLAIGIDIAFPEDSQFVHYGDFHNIPYPENCFDYVYMNSFDHVLKPKEVLKEIGRVLKKEKGILIMDLVKGTKEGFPLKGIYESFAWEYRNNVLDLINDEGFRMIKANSRGNEWTQYLFKAEGG